MTVAALPTEEQAVQAANFMAAEVHAPAFFEKLAEHGYETANPAEQQQLLQLGAVLADAEARGQIKSAAPQGENPFLSHVLNRWSSAPDPADVESHQKEAAVELAKAQPIVKNAALIWNHLQAGGEIEKPQEQPQEQPEAAAE